MSQRSTFLPEDPPLVHAGGEEDGRLGDAHQQVGDGQVNDEHVGRRPQAAAPVGGVTEEWAEQRALGMTLLHLEGCRP